MRYVDRSKVVEPVELNKPNKSGGTTEFDRALNYERTRPPGGKAFAFTKYKDRSVKNTLIELFFNKCAFCECDLANQPGDVEHYRPKGSVDDSEHSGYWWLAADWTNLLLSCTDCNRRRYQSIPSSIDRHSLVRMNSAAVYQSMRLEVSGKGAAFPLEHEKDRAQFHESIHRRVLTQNKEKPLLLDPTNDDPADHIRYDAVVSDPISIAYPAPSKMQGDTLRSTSDMLAENALLNDQRPSVSTRGAVSIQLLGLNRLTLLQARTRIYIEMKLLWNLIVELNADILELDNHFPEITRDPVDSENNQTKIIRRVKSTLSHVSKELEELLVQRTHATMPYSMAAHTWLTALVNSHANDQDL